MADIHVGDVGTLYQMPIYDSDLEDETFDPTLAVSKTLFFKMPGNTVTIERAATVATVTIDGDPVYCLTYEVQTADVDEENVSGSFHTAPGHVTLQAELEYADGRKWRSSKVKTDHLGRVLKVQGNL